MKEEVYWDDLPAKVRPDYKSYHPRIAPLKRNEKMVDLPGVVAVVACYDGRLKGGTYQAIGYARKKGIEVVMVKAREP